MESMGWNNQVVLRGVMETELMFTHRVFGEKFYEGKMSISRLSGSQDIIPLTVSENLIDTNRRYLGRKVEVTGQLRSSNYIENGHRRLLLTVHAKKFAEKPDDWPMKDEIYLEGFLCRNAVYRTTPLKKEISDILMAVSRPYRRTDYIPCVLWGRVAREGKNLKTGAHVAIWGRFQSRDYVKQGSNGVREHRVAYEVSTDRLEVLSRKGR